MDTREFSGVSADQLEAVVDFLDAHPIKVPVRSEDGGSWVFWESSEQAIEDEAKRMVLRKAVRRYDHEVMSYDERLMLEDRIRRLRRQLGIA